MIIDLRIDKPRFMVFGEIALRASALAAAPLVLILDVHKPRPSDITIHVTSKSLRAEVLRIVAGVDAEIKRFISAHVSVRSTARRRARRRSSTSVARSTRCGRVHDWADARIRPYALAVPRKTKTASLTALTVGALMVAVPLAAPAQADPTDDAFINALSNAGVGVTNPADAVQLGQSVCPMLSQPGQTAADAASQVANAAGMSLGPATMFTGLAISIFCPGSSPRSATGSHRFRSAYSAASDSAVRTRRSASPRRSSRTGRLGPRPFPADSPLK
jgi:hypothetical protein